MHHACQVKKRGLTRGLSPSPFRIPITLCTLIDQVRIGGWTNRSSSEILDIALRSWLRSFLSNRILQEISDEN